MDDERLWTVALFADGHVEMDLAVALRRAELAQMLLAIADGLMDGTLVQRVKPRTSEALAGRFAALVGEHDQHDDAN